MADFYLVRTTTPTTADAVPLSALGTGTPDNTKFLRGDGAWASPGAGGAHKSTHQSGGNDALTVMNANTGDVTANAADTYLTGSSLLIGGLIKAGTILRWRLVCTKTAAGTAAAAFNLRFGTNGTTGDSARVTFTLSSATAATDTGYFDIVCVVRAINASTGVVSAGMSATHSTTGTTGLWSANEVFVAQSTSGNFDNTSSSLIAGVSCNPGASGVWTFQLVTAEAVNLA